MFSNLKEITNKTRLDRHSWNGNDKNRSDKSRRTRLPLLLILQLLLLQYSYNCSSYCNHSYFNYYYHHFYEFVMKVWLRKLIFQPRSNVANHNYIVSGVWKIS